MQRRVLFSANAIAFHLKSRATASSVALGAALLIAAAACDKQPAPPPAKPSAPQTADKDLEALRDKVVGQPGSAALPANHPPISGQPAAASAPAQDGIPAGHPPINAARPAAPFAAMSADPPKYDVPAEWKAQQPKTPMRKAQYTLPGDGGDGEMILFYFGKGEGGDVEANLARWKAMFATAEGQPLPEDACKVDRLTVNELKVTTLDVSGTYREPAMMNPQAPPARPDYRMMCAIVEMPNGNWFFKGTGPAATMATHDAAFRKLIQSLKSK